MFGRLIKAYRESIDNKARAANLKEVRLFIDSLRDLSDEDMAVVIAVTTVIRINLEEHGYLPRNLFFDTHLPAPNDLARYQMELNKLTRDFKRMKQPTDAVAAAVLSISLRCLNVPYLRDMGREMWEVLSRGFRYGEETIKKGEEEKGEALDPRVWAEWNKIPHGLQPLTSESSRIPTS